MDANACTRSDVADIRGVRRNWTSWSPSPSLLLLSPSLLSLLSLLPLLSLSLFLSVSGKIQEVSLVARSW